jgi:hypothetical protein
MADPLQTFRRRRRARGARRSADGPQRAGQRAGGHHRRRLLAPGPREHLRRDDGARGRNERTTRHPAETSRSWQPLHRGPLPHQLDQTVPFARTTGARIIKNQSTRRALAVAGRRFSSSPAGGGDVAELPTRPSGRSSSSPSDALPTCGRCPSSSKRPSRSSTR